MKLSDARVIALRIRDEARPLPRIKPLYGKVPRSDGLDGQVFITALLWCGAAALFIGPLAWWLHGLFAR